MNLEGVCPLTTADVLDRAVAIEPSLEAVVSPAARIHYEGLRAQARRIASALTAAGIGRGDHVALALGNGPRWAALFYGITAIGAVAVPVNTRFRADELAYVLSQSRSRLLVVADRFLRVDLVGMLRSLVPDLDGAGRERGELAGLERIVVIGEDVPASCERFEDFLAAGADVAETEHAVAGDVALMQYTSGTTAFPKGVLLTHRSLCADAFFSGGRLGLRLGDRFHSARPFFHVAGTTLSLLASAQHVASLVTMDRFEPGEALRLMESERCTHFSGNDTMALMLLGHPSLPDRRLSLRGAWLAASPTVVRRVVDELGAVEAVVGYGLSEASPNVAQSSAWEPLELRLDGSMPPEPGVEVRIADPDTGVELAPGTPGEILVRGWNVMLGYFERPDETAEALRDGWLHTGDLGSFEGGRLRFLGRLKEIIRVGGENVSPAEVEDVLHRHPLIRQAVVVGVPDDRLVEVPFAFVLLTEGATVGADEILRWAEDAMAGFKAPRHVEFVTDLDALGMTASGKVTKRTAALRAVEILAGTTR